jgi:MoxR-like ATPase
VTIADMIGDMDPIKAARRRPRISDELTIHYGLLPRANRGIFAINELPDLAGKIQVGLFNIMQEGDVQIKGYPVRLPLDVLLVFTANPEDYTARGKIITPLKDRIGSEIRTHYPLTLEQGMAITQQEPGRGGLRPWRYRSRASFAKRSSSWRSGAGGQARGQALGRLPALADLRAGERGVKRRTAGARLRGPGGGAPGRRFVRGAPFHHRQDRA